MIKKYFVLVLFFFLTIGHAQSPEKFTYQSIIKTSTGYLLKNQDVGLRISILRNSSNGIEVYSEEHFPTSNSNGLVTLIIGEGLTGDNFSDINWGGGEYFLKVEVDPEGGVNYTMNQTSQLLSVPYALYAENAKLNLLGQDFITLQDQTLTINKVDLADDVEGILPVANGGTGSDTAPMVGVITAADEAAARSVLGLGTAATTDSTDYATAAQGLLADSAQQPPIEGAFVDGDKTKLDGIEALADVTDTANVSAAGALMESEVTNLAQVKAFDSSAYATAAQGVKADSAQQPPIEGAFVDGDKTKLDGIEALADVTNTANVSAAGALMESEVTNLAQVKAFDSSAYATAAQGVKADSAQQPPIEGAFVDGDKTKLDGIEALADVTNTANVSAAGALMESEVTNLAQVKAFDSSAYATALQGTKADSAQQPPIEGAFVDGDKTKLDGIEALADVTNTANVSAAGALMESEVTNLAQVKAFDSSEYATALQGTKADSAQQPPVEGAFVDGDKTKLDGIEALADVTNTANVSAAGALMESEVTNLAQVKAFDSSAYATAAQGVKADSAQQPPIEGAFVDGDKTKLDGIEALADVTNTANVSAAGALMESEVTNLAQVKAFDSSAYATALQGTKADGALQAANDLSDLNDAATARTNLGVDIAGTDNSTDISLDASSQDYIVLDGQVLTINKVDASTDIIGLANVAISGDYGDLTNVPSTAGAAIYNNAGSPALDVGITASEVNSLLGLGTAATTASTDYALSSNNSSDVTLSGLYDYLTLVGQTITLDLITNDDLAGSIANDKLSNSTVSYGGISLALGGTDATPAFDLTDATNYPTTSLAGSITNTQLAGSIANDKLSNSTVSYGGISLALGGTDATPAFDLTDATNYPTTSLAGSITNTQLAGSIANDKLSNSTVSYGGISLALGGTDATPAFDLTDATNYPTTSLAGSITNTQLAGSIANDKLSNSTVSYGGISLALGGTDATPAFDLTDATNYPTTSLAGSITNTQLAGSIANDKLSNSTVSYGGISLALGGTDATPAFDLTDATNYPTTSLAGSITNTQLAGSIANDKLSNSTVSYGGISLALGGTDATPAFDLTDATNYPTTSLAGSITNTQLAGSIANDKLSNSTVSYGGISLALGGTDATPAFDLTDATNYPTTSLAGSITNTQLAGSIANDKLSNSTVSYGGISLALGGTDATPAFDLTDATNYPTTSLAGSITNTQLAGSIANDKLSNSTVSYGGISLALGGTDATPAFDLTDATNYPTTSLAGSITNAQLAGSIDLTSKVANTLPVTNGGTGGTTTLSARTALGIIAGILTLNGTTASPSTINIGVDENYSVNVNWSLNNGNRNILTVLSNADGTITINLNGPPNSGDKIYFIAIDTN